MRRASSRVFCHLSPHPKLSFSLLSRDFITHLSSLPTTTTNQHHHYHHHHLPSQTHLESCTKSDALLFSKFKTHQFQIHPSHNLNTLVDQQPPISSRQRKIKERSQLDEAFESAKTTEDMLKAFKDMEASFDERELGLACLKLGLKLDQEVQLELANSKTAMGRREEALGNLRNCLDIKKMTLEKNSREIGNANRDLAEAYVAVLNFKEALPFCLKALEIHKGQLGNNSVEVAHDRRLLGVIYTGLEEHEKALEQNQLSQKVLKNWGLSSDLLRAEIDASNIQIALGKYEEAINTLKDIVQQTNKESEDRAMVFISMAKALCNQEKFADSKRCLQIASGILDKKEATSPVEVSEAYMEISMQYETMNEFETAIALLKRTQAILEKLPQEQHSEGSVSARIGWLLLLTGKVQEAIPYLESAAERLKECFGSKHYGVGYIYNNLGAAYLELDRPQSAAQMFAVAKEIMDASLGPGHVDTIESCQNLSKAYGAMGSYPLAIKFQEQVIDAWEGHGPSAQDELKEARRLLEKLKKEARGASSNEPPVRALPLPHNSHGSTRSCQPGVSISERQSSTI
ncbi:unnamed protein product [Camellia sinensis]|uniref:protein KINESIN LIGHT CHAIN-RELATED 1 isoform X2 n=1 Tax=Camellia sinensis TaxID=4442 RepID=UPI0010368162|nr:protein KINESIN LIGHT CHAIN-RELATED 1 isoform X2 [Camellia sinensis]